MSCSPSIPLPTYAVAEKALRRWAAERLQRHPRADGGTVYVFALTGSTCTNVPLEVTMTVFVGPDGRINGAMAHPAPNDSGCNRTCGASGDGAGFFADHGTCDEAIGLTIQQAAFRNWQEEPSGCFCSAAHRRHKWRNVFQTLHYALRDA